MSIITTNKIISFHPHGTHVPSHTDVGGQGFLHLFAIFLV